MPDIASFPDDCRGRERVVAERRHSLGEDHPETLSAMLDLADCLWAQGRLIAARKLEERVVEGRRRKLGDQHPDTLKALGKLAVTLAAQGDLEQARALQEEVVAGRLCLYGERDLETLRAVNNLAGTVASQGDLVTARELLESVLATTCREFGEEPAILWQGGESDEAYALQQQVFEMQRRLHGDSNEATRAAAAVLQTMEQDPGF